MLQIFCLTGLASLVPFYHKNWSLSFWIQNFLPSSKTEALRKCWCYYINTAFKKVFLNSWQILEMMENSLRLSFYLGSSLLILFFSYPDSKIRLSGLFNPVPLSPNNWGSTAIIIIIKPAASTFLLLVNYHILLLEMVFVPDKSTIKKIKKLYQSSHKSLFK